ncbi:hypothetical protein [Undibacterium sp.]|uniref:hypothetical protein n=1 Tax=Undibacterium sp. TaxID=1914977 RepID=UPI00374FDD0B
MEQHQKSVDDPITAKLPDIAVLEKVMRQALTKAIERARQLGYLKTPYVQDDAVEYKPD